MTNDINITLFQPDDAPDICDIYRETYGDDFPIPYVYIPEEIIKRYDGINHRTAIARTKDGQFAGMASMFRSTPNPLMYEAGQLMIKKNFRKMGIADHLVKTIHVEFPTQVPIKGQFVEALCNHTISQKLSEGYSFIPTALEIEWLPTINFDSAKALERNISLLMEFKTFNDTPHEIFLHPAYIDYVTDRCRALKAERTIKSDFVSGTRTTEKTTDIIADAGIATLSVTHAGADWPEILAHFETEAAMYRRQVRIDISHPSAPWAINLMRENGFFLGGYLPLWFEGDGLLLQKLTKTPDFSLPQFFSDEGNSVMEAVQTDYVRATSA